MIRDQVEAYLDGDVSVEGRSALESQFASDAEARRVLAAATANRALRAAALATYMPSAGESAGYAARVLAACQDDAGVPVGRIGFWVGRGLATAAGLALLVGAFAAGRMTGNKAVGPTIAAQAEVVRVLYADDGGEPQMKEFANLDDANSFCRDMAAKHAEPVVVASGFDEEHPGSF